MTDPIMVVDQLSHSYTGPAGALTVLSNISFEVQRQEFVCLVGPSGCGKSTLLRLMAGLLLPTQGRICLNDQPLDGPRRQIGVVFQKANLMPWRSTRDNVLLPLELSGIDKQAARQRADELLKLVGLDGFESSHPSDLSGGMEHAGRASGGRDWEFILDQCGDCGSRGDSFASFVTVPGSNAERQRGVDVVKSCLLKSGQERDWPLDVEKIRK